MDAIDQIDLRTLRLFAVAARQGSFAEAGRKLGMPRTQASKLISELEVTLGGKLFRRTTRKVALTDLGKQLLARIGPSLTDLQTGLEQTRSHASATAGVVRFSASHAFGRRFVVPALQTFMARHPEIRIELLLHDDLDDLIARTLDFTIRLGPLPQTTLISRRLGMLKVVAVAERRLLGRAPALSSPDDLRKLPAIPPARRSAHPAAWSPPALLAPSEVPSGPRGAGTARCSSIPCHRRWPSWSSLRGCLRPRGRRLAAPSRTRG
jgi:DNA-binding transcriptional LysR family regulator